MRISWGYKIVIFYLSFVTGMLFLVYKATTQSFDLVTENYYEAELKYQEVIDQKNNVASLSTPPKITHTVNSVIIQLPGEFINKPVEGEIYLYRASDASKDLKRKFTTQDGFHQLDIGKDLSGSYDIKLSWTTNGRQFFHEQKIFF